MPDTDGDLPNASASSKASLNAPPDSTDTAQTESRPNQAGRGRFVPLSTLWWNLLCAAIIAPLAFVMLALALLWDQWLPLALVAFAPRHRRRCVGRLVPDDAPTLLSRPTRPREPAPV